MNSATAQKHMLILKSRSEHLHFSSAISPGPDTIIFLIRFGFGYPLFTPEQHEYFVLELKVYQKENENINVLPPTVGTERKTEVKL